MNQPSTQRKHRKSPLKFFATSRPNPQALRRSIGDLSGDNPDIADMRDELKAEFLSAHPDFVGQSKAELQRRMRDHDQNEERLHRQRLLANLKSLYGNIVAVICTIMLLEIPLPNGSGGYPVFLKAVGVFLVSFFVIAYFWYSNHQTFERAEGVGEGVIVQVFVYLGLLSLIPLLTKWIMIDPARFAMLNYGLVVLALLMLGNTINHSLARDHFRGMPKSFAFWRRSWRRRTLISAGVDIAATGFACGLPQIGYWLFIAIPIVNFFFLGVGSDSGLEGEEEKLVDRQIEDAAAS